MVLSGNLGTAAVIRQVGPLAGLVVGLVDMAKGVGAILIARSLGLPRESDAIHRNVGTPLFASFSFISPQLGKPLF